MSGVINVPGMSEQSVRIIRDETGETVSRGDARGVRAIIDFCDAAVCDSRGQRLRGNDCRDRLRGSA